MKGIGLIFSVLLFTLPLLAGKQVPEKENLEIHRHVYTRFYLREANFRLYVRTVAASKKNNPVRIRIQDNIPQDLKLVRGNNIWEGKIDPGKDSYDAGYSGYELLIPSKKGKKYIIKSAVVILKDNGKTVQCFTKEDTVIFGRGISDIWDRYDFYVNIPADFYLENEMKDKHFLTFTGYPFDPRWIFIWWKDVKNEKINGKLVANRRVEIGKKLYNDERDKISEILPCGFLNYKAFKVKGKWKNPTFDTEGVFETIGFVDTVQNRLYLIDMLTFGCDKSRLVKLEKAAWTFKPKVATSYSITINPEENSKTLRVDGLFSFALPIYYVAQYDEGVDCGAENFVRFIVPNPFRLIFIYWEDHSVVQKPDLLISKRARLVDQYYHNDRIISWKAENVNFRGIKSIKLRGRWENPNFKLNGCFETYCFNCTEKNKFVMIDLVVCNPREKVEEPYLEELRNIITGKAFPNPDKSGFLLYKGR